MTQETKKILLHNGQYAIVDADDFDRLNVFHWHNRNLDDYPMRSTKNANGSKVHRNMAYDVLNIDSLANTGKCIDHINHNRLDNRKSNLRIVSLADNSRNKGKTKGASSKYLGVYAARGNKKPWKMTITCSCNTEEEAARWYDKAASFLFGAAANLNFTE